MKKLSVIFLLIINCANFVCAQELVLSDRIREALEAKQREEAKAKVNNLEPINKDNKKVISEENLELSRPNQQDFCKQ